MTTTLVGYNVSRDRVTVNEQFLRFIKQNEYSCGEVLISIYLSIRLWSGEQFLEVLITLLLLVTRFPPLCNGLAVEDKDMEEGVEEEDDIRLN